MSGCSDYGKYTLIFSGSLVGTFVHGWTTTPRRLTDVNVRHNFWSQQAILDGHYPAVVWDTRVTLYTESGSVIGFIKDFVAFGELITPNAQSTQIRRQVGSVSTPTDPVVADFGNCYMTSGPDLRQPDMLLFTRAGMVVLDFIGNTHPVIL